MMETYLMKKFMKNHLKTVVVKCLDWQEEIDIDYTIFSDIFMEAATRIVEKNKDSNEFKVSVIIECYEKQHTKDQEQHFAYNTYFVFVNAALYAKAEELRLNFFKEHKIDLRKESLKASDDGSNPSTNPTIN